MNAEQLRELQAPLKTRYRNDPASAKIKVHARGELSPGVTCTVQTDLGPLAAGLHPAAGGDGSKACSGDMLLQALVACVGVTLNAVATALQIPIRKATVTAEGVFDARGTLGVSKEATVGCETIDLSFEIDSDAGDEQLEKLLQLTERYCVVLQTLSRPPRLTASLKRGTDGET